MPKMSRFLRVTGKNWSDDWMLRTRIRVPDLRGRKFSRDCIELKILSEPRASAKRGDFAGQ